MVATAPRICVLTAAHLATCPRMVKAADALAEAGYAVRVVSSRFMDWATRADTDLVRRRAGRWRWTPVDYSRASAPGTALYTSLRSRMALRASHITGVERCPWPVAVWATVRNSPELAQAVLAEPMDFLYAGGGATAAALAVARKTGIPFALDLEDFYGEQNFGEDGAWYDRLFQQVERRVLPHARFLTAGSVGIAEQYAVSFGLQPIPVHNVFPLPATPPVVTLASERGLRLYWFSQTIGAGRGLEDAIQAMGLAGIPGELHLRGRAVPAYRRELETLAAGVAPRLRLFWHEPAPPDDLIEQARGYDIGLALERETPLNKSICLSNKACTYLPAGLAVVLSDTVGQRRLAAEIGEAGLLYRGGDSAALAQGLLRWWQSPAQLIAAREAAWQAAQQRWHWEHPLERGRLLQAFETVLGQPAPRPHGAAAR